MDPHSRAEASRDTPAAFIAAVTLTVAQAVRDYGYEPPVPLDPRPGGFTIRDLEVFARALEVDPVLLLPG